MHATQSDLQIQWNSYLDSNGILNRTDSFKISMVSHVIQNNQNSLEKEKAGDITLPSFKLYYKKSNPNRTVLT